MKILDFSDWLETKDGKEAMRLLAEGQGKFAVNLAYLCGKQMVVEYALERKMYKNE